PRAVEHTHRQAGDTMSQLVDLKAGELFRVDFVLRQNPRSLEKTQERRDRGEIAQASVGGLGGAGLGAAGQNTPSAAEPRPCESLLPDSFAGGGAGSFSVDRQAGPQAGDPSALREEPGASPVAVSAGPRLARASLLALGLFNGRLELWRLRTGSFVTRRDRFEDELRDMAATSEDERLRAAGRGALFVSGPVARSCLLSLRLDSERDPRARLFRDIRPDEDYPIYGDASVPGFAAPSRGRSYARLERDHSFAQYGDFQTAGPTALSSLGAFRRSLTGGLTHLEWDRGAMETFASRGVSRQVGDEPPGPGISGPYALNRTDGLVNSEQVEIVTRDRNRPSVIIGRETQERFRDYSIEPFTGRLIFRRPVPSVDDHLNPVSVRVTYESESGGERFWVFGANGRLRPHPKVELGGSVAIEDAPLAEHSVQSASAAVNPLPGLTLVAEAAHSDSASKEGRAARGEVRFADRGFDLQASAVRVGSDFSNPSSGFAAGRTELGLNAGYALSPATRLFADALRSADRLRGGPRRRLQRGGG